MLILTSLDHWEYDCLPPHAGPGGGLLGGSGRHLALPGAPFLSLSDPFSADSPRMETASSAMVLFSLHAAFTPVRLQDPEVMNSQLEAARESAQGAPPAIRRTLEGFFNQLESLNKSPGRTAAAGDARPKAGI